MLDVDASAVGIPIGHDIGTMPLAPASSCLAVRRPSDVQPSTDLPVADATILDRAVCHAERAIRASGWATRPPRERARTMHRRAELIDA